MEHSELLPSLFRTEYSKIIAVLCNRFGIEHIEVAEDIVSDTFLTATELWGMKGIPANPVAWLYTVAKNKTRNYLRRTHLFQHKIAETIKPSVLTDDLPEIDLSDAGIADSQLAMIFTICDPILNAEAQIAMALNLLCGFSIQEIADAFLTNRDVIYKRIQRSKETLRTANIQIAFPTTAMLESRLQSVLTTLYLLFNEGYYSVSTNHPLREGFCMEAMRLTKLLTDNAHTNQPAAYALMALMCFHTSRFDARTNEQGELILYQDQDTSLWNQVLIEKGILYFNQAAQGNLLTKFHLEAAIAYWHTRPENTLEKWGSVLQLYNQLLIQQYTPMAALNRTYALARANSIDEAIREAEKLNLHDNHFYHVLLGTLYKEKLMSAAALTHLLKAQQIAKSEKDKQLIQKKIDELKG